MFTRPSAANAAERRRGLRGGLVVAPELVRQPGVRVDRHGHVGDPSQLLEVWPERPRPERAVEPDAERPGVADRVPERLGGLARQRPAAGVRDRPRDHQWQAEPEPLEQLVDGEDRGLRIERVEDRLDDEEVHAALDQPVGRLAVGRHEIVEPDIPGTGVGDVRRDGRGPVRRADRPTDVARTAGLARLERIGGFPGESGRGHVDLADDGLEAVVGLGDRGRGEGVRLDDVRAGLEIGVVDRSDDVGPGQREEVVVPAQVARMTGETFAAEVGLGQPVALDHRAHRAVHDEDPLSGQRAEEGQPAGAGEGRGDRLGDPVARFSGCGHRLRAVPATLVRPGFDRCQRPRRTASVPVPSGPGPSARTNGAERLTFGAYPLREPHLTMTLTTDRRGTRCSSTSPASPGTA